MSSSGSTLFSARTVLIFGEIEARQIIAMRQRLNRIFAEATGQAIERIAKDTERNHWLNAEEARDYGLVGTIVRSAAELGSER
jgi:ATP-dependent Clp protease protease subunit